MTRIISEIRYSLEILDAIFTSTARIDERVSIFADVVKAQSIENKISWKKMISQYESLAFELYKNNEKNFFKNVRKYIKEHS